MITAGPPLTASQFAGTGRLRSEVRPYRPQPQVGVTSMPTGRGGVGSHKHGVSGTPGRNSKYKAAQLREARKEEERERQRREKRIPPYTSPTEAVRTFRPK